MQFEYNVNPKLKIMDNAGTEKELFGKIGKLDEVFGHSKCQSCGDTKIKYVCRTQYDPKKKKDFTYYELWCENPNCRARKAFGQTNDDSGTLFPRRKDAEDNYLPNDGWVKWEGKKEE